VGEQMVGRLHEQKPFPANDQRPTILRSRFPAVGGSRLRLTVAACGAM
jgi:hypothetical protein